MERKPSRATYEAFYRAHLAGIKIGKSNQATALCPFHPDKNPSFSLNLENGLWMCHQCRAKGNIFIFANKTEIPRSELPEEVRDAYYNGKIFLPRVLADEIGEIDSYIAVPINLGGMGDRLHIYCDGVYKPGGEKVARTMAHQILGKHSKQDRIDAVIASLKESVKREIDQTNFDALRFINVENCMVDWATGDTALHSEDFFSTFQIHARFNPGANSPIVDRFLRDVFPGDSFDLAQEILGILLIPDTSHQKAFVLVGEGANGKSTFLNMVIQFIGEENIARISLQDLERNKFRAAELLNKLVNIYPDLPNSVLKETDIFKMIVSGESFTAERKYGHPFILTPFARFLFSANVFPDTSDRTLAFFRRLIMIPFTRRFEGQRADPKIIDRLITPEARSALFNHALTGLRRLKKNGHFSLSTSTEQALDEYRIQTDDVFEFLDQEVKKQPNGRIGKDVLYQKYKMARQWSEDKPVKQKEFNQKVASKFGAVEKKVGTIRMWVGVEWSKQ